MAHKSKTFDTGGVDLRGKWHIQREKLCVSGYSYLGSSCEWVLINRKVKYRDKALGALHTGTNNWGQRLAEKKENKERT